MLKSRLILTDTQIKALPATYFQITPIRAGKAPLLIALNITANCLAGAYSAVDPFPTGYMEVQDSRGAISYPWAMDILLASAANRSVNPSIKSVIIIAPPADLSPSLGAGPSAGDFLAIATNNTAAAFTGGNPANTMTIDVWYDYIDVP